MKVWAADRIMKWIYGKQDWKTLERGEENCYLMANGLGGFSSMTAVGAVTRNDHAFLMACVKAPNHRYNLVHRLRETLIFDGEEEVFLSSQEFAEGDPENGYTRLTSFVWEDTPVWLFQADGVQVRKEAALKYGENKAALQYKIVNRSRRTCRIEVTPFYQFVPKGKDMEDGLRIDFDCEKASCGNLSLFLRSSGGKETICRERETYYYRWDECDGRRKHGTAEAGHKIFQEVLPGEERILSIVFETEQSEETADQIIVGQKVRRKELERKAGFRPGIACELAKGAAEFIADRESSGGKTILAGFPFFEDWGRDTMISLPGICISTGQYEIAKDILLTFAEHERGGLMPNLFPEGTNEPMYNTVDAALLFIHCVYRYYNSSKDREFVKKMYPVMERIMTGYMEGTDFGIFMDEDGLISAGRDLDQVTWMDVRCGDILPTPRHGKPVEINAYWYNALRMMELLGEIAGNKDTRIYETTAAKVKSVFEKKFWMEEKNCLRDVLSGTGADEQIRCNQIWAVSMPFSLLEKGKEKQVVETVFEKLYTPYGLRTLEKDDREFHPVYEGKMEERDLAYHQGTVWTFPLGAYYLAYLKVNGYSESAKKIVSEQLEVMESALREGCIGQLPEIYDGENPVSSKGCFAQAWSVGEILRVYEALGERV